MKIGVALKIFWLYNTSKTCFIASKDDSILDKLYHKQFISKYQANKEFNSQTSPEIMKMYQKLGVYSNRVIRSLSFLKYGKASALEQKAKVWQIHGQKYNKCQFSWKFDQIS